MAMVGLFWIAEGDVYVGAKPSGLAPGARLTPEGVVALGERQSGVHLWEDVRALTVTDVPVKSLVRQAGVFRDLAVTMVVNLAMPMGPDRTDEAPALMTLRVTSPAADHELSVYAAAAAGYSPAEVELSLALLSRLTDGAATMATTLAAMSQWGRASAGGTPRGPERERLLRSWAAG
ncbi:hypothetical protein ACGF7W_24480 [Streptomyces sp. NPDC048219]|uniref:hypothetical protein n=1 Tax=Streptomyces sp. NPDC048219 TaxID=3365517 RepID=UPI003716D30B